MLYWINLTHALIRSSWPMSYSVLSTVVQFLKTLLCCFGSEYVQLKVKFRGCVNYNKIRGVPALALFSLVSPFAAQGPFALSLGQIHGGPPGLLALPPLLCSPPQHTHLQDKESINRKKNEDHFNSSDCRVFSSHFFCPESFHQF